MASATQSRGQLQARLQRLFARLNLQYFGLRLYQWLWVLLCVAGALAVAAPRVLSQPLLYYANAETRFDTTRYGGIYGQVAPRVSGLQVAIGDASEALRQRALASGDVRLGQPTYRVEFLPGTPGVVQVRAAGGREILRNMLGWELWLAMEPQGLAAPGPFDLLLREIIRSSAFPMSRDLEPVSTPRDIAALPREELSDLARALEARSDLWRFALNTRNATLDALCATSGLSDTAAREAALETCAATSPAAAVERAERDREIARLRAVEAALAFVLEQPDARFDPTTPSAAHSVAATPPVAPEPRYIPQLILLATLVGLAFGTAGVAVDRSAGVTGKVVEIWGYRELIRNLVLRDLRSRYKGSALGYLWTQLAPLGMMLVYVIVFGLLLPGGIAQFPVFIIVALLPWNYTAEAVMSGTRSIIDNAALVKKVYFPREVLPLTGVLSSLLNFLLSLPMMFLVMAVVQLLSMGRLNFSWTFAYLPVLIIIQTVLLAGLALLLGATAVFFRDVVHLVGIIVNIWFFLTPVIYPLSTLGDGPAVRLLRWLNPMASLIEFYREVLYGAAVPLGQIPTPGLPALTSVLRVSVTALLILAVGYWLFQRGSRRFGEEI